MNEQVAWKTDVKWRGTEISIDLHCPTCGDLSSFFGTAALYLRCPSCRTCYALPTDLPLKKVEGPEPDDGVLPADTDVDEDE
jgi:ribosomal protein S27E